MSPNPSQSLPVVVIGAGPVGLAAAAHLEQQTLPWVVLEAGPEVGAGVRSWGHVQLFSRWDQLIDPAARKVLAPTGWVEPDATAYPTGAEWLTAYLQPLADALGDGVRTGSRVRAVTRRGRDLLADHERAAQPFVVHLDTADGPERLLAAAVIDASGTIATPNPIGADGVPAIGEAAAADRLHAGAPDLDDPQTRARHAGRHTVVVGTGHTAMTALVALGRLARDEPDTRISWIRRRALGGEGLPSSAFGGGADDQLAARGALGAAAAAAVAAGHVEVVGGFRVAEVIGGRTALTLRAEDGRTVEGVDAVVVATGYRPDLALAGELRLDLDRKVQAPTALAPLIDPNLHSCGTVPPHGVAELRHPDEEGFFLAGMKAYGRAPTFLALTGYEQVRSIVAHLAGDEEGAREVRLVLPETGICNGPGLVGAEPEASSVTAGALPLLSEGASGSCCG